MDNLTFDDICRKLTERDNFSFQRVGDGEWHAILGDSGMNCDNHPYYHEMSLALAMTLLQDQACYMGMQPFALKRLGARIHEWIADNGCDIKWCDADIIHDASTDGRLGELHDALRGRKIILVGPNHLRQIAQKMQAVYVNCPDKYPCWKAWTTMYTDMSEQLEKDTVVLYCAGMPSGVMIDKACREYGNTITQLDLGSALDPYAGRLSRRYHQKILERLKEEAI